MPLARRVTSPYPPPNAAAAVAVAAIPTPTTTAPTLPRESAVVQADPPLALLLSSSSTAHRQDTLSLRLPSRKSRRNWAPHRRRVNRHPGAALRSHKSMAPLGAHPPERPLVLCSPPQTRGVHPRHLVRSLRTCYDTPCHPRRHNGRRPRRVSRPGDRMYTTSQVHQNFSTMIQKRQSRPMLATSQPPDPAFCVLQPSQPCPHPSGLAA